MSRQDLMMLSTPNSGTTWIAPLIANSFGDTLRYYDKEFFNPVCNPLHQHEISQVFGTHTALWWENIANPNIAVGQILKVVKSTWQQYAWNFDKENFSYMPNYIEAYKKHFRLFRMKRRMHDTFPPGRDRVMHWYEAIGSSYMRWDQGENWDPKKCAKETTLWQRAQYGWHRANEALDSYGLPTIREWVLVDGTPQEVYNELRALLELFNFTEQQLINLASKVVETRKPRGRRNWIDIT